MMFRRVPPVRSPVSASALAKGLHALVSDRAVSGARVQMDEWVRRTFAAAAWQWTSSGTAALSLAIRLAHGVERDAPPVALPAYGCYDLATACDGAAVPVALYDVDPATLGPDWDSLEGLLRRGSRVVVLAHFFGLPVEWERARSLASQYGAILIEDAAQGNGATYAGRPLGALGDLAILSFGRGKGQSAGAGGLLLGHGPRFAEAMGGLALEKRAAGGFRPLIVSTAQAMLGRPALYWLPAMLPMLELGKTIYHPFVEPGGMARSAMGMLPDSTRAATTEAQVRRRNAARLLALLPEPWLRGVVAPLPGSVPGYLRLPVLAPDAAQAIRADRLGRLGIARSYPLSLADLPGFRSRLQPSQGSFAGAQTLAQRLVTLPTHGWVDDRMTQEIATELERS